MRSSAIVCAIQGCGFEAVIFADDCNAFRCFPRSVPNHDIQDALSVCQRALHLWGHANRVTFDPGKEDTMVVSTNDGEGGPAKLLGIEFDNKLLMGLAT